jgi:hypothetical protein
LSATRREQQDACGELDRLANRRLLHPGGLGEPRPTLRGEVGHVVINALRRGRTLARKMAEVVARRNLLAEKVAVPLLPQWRNLDQPRFNAT